MTDAIYPQVRIVTERLLNPATVERVMNLIVATGGVRRAILNGPRIPATITYGPAKGQPNVHDMRRTIQIGDQPVELQVHVGTIILELESKDAIPAIRAACEAGFRDLPWYLQEGRFMKTEPSLVDYAKYGPDADKAIIGMADPSSRSGPIILQGTK
jgi:methyl-coenzyme M reductase subunit D